jgi:N-acetylmuramoyl-L-alanine amidase
MIATLAAVLQIAVAPPPAALTVRIGERASVAPFVHTSAGPAIAPERLASVLDVQLRAEGSMRHVLTVEGVAFQLAEQVPFARVGTEVVPLVGAPFSAGGRLHVPVQLFAEVLPRMMRGAVYDPARAELRIFRTAAGRPPASPPREDASARAAPAPASPSPIAKAPPPPSPAPGTPARKRVVVVDAGHGGHDPGTSGRTRSGVTLIEKDVALAVARLLETELRKRNLDVVMTRSSDVFIPLPDRGRIANERHGDLFISVHVNASGPSAKNGAAARGVETYFLAVAKTEDAQRVADMENASVRFETGAEVAKDDPLSFILNDMAENEHLRESSDLAAQIQRRMTAGQPTFDRGVKQGPFRVLVTSYMPAVLVELGYATNPDDAARLLEPASQKKMAEAIATAAVDYFAAYDRRLRAGTPDR